MAVTIHKQPLAYSPAYNPLVFYAKSNQTAQPNFNYRVIVTDIITSEFQTYWIDADPDGFCRFDASPFAVTRFTHTLPINTYGWQKDLGTRKLKVNIGEYYGASPTYYAGTDLEYILWDGVEDVMDFPTYNFTSYLYDDSTANYKYLTSQLDGLAYTDRSDYFYALTKGAGDLKFLIVKTYNSSGVLQGAYKISNPHEASTLYIDKYLCIDVGIKGLTNIPSGQVTVMSGVFPINWSNVAYYEVSETNSTATEPATRSVKKYTVGCSPRFPIYTLHFLRKTGAFETCHFSKRSDFTSSKVGSSYSVFPYHADGVSDYSYSRSTQFEKVISIEETNRMRLNTDMLTPNQVDLYKELFTSPLIYLDLGSSRPYEQIKFISDSYKLNKRWNEKLYNLSADFEFTAKNYRQR